MGDDNDKRDLSYFAQLTEREAAEVHFAKLYAQHYHHGTDGHSRLMLIARLAELLEQRSPPAAPQKADTGLLTPAGEVPKDAPMPTQWNLRKPEGFA